ncbi:FMN-binding negative transcriptional regulator [Phreatobacter stygius]|uniref:FMN-binding negative transcriptional regulator n=1 Tax=Phreatobacter stygius TaxID=1940610 RepID=A0A4D7AZJ0_9HYPH|nr:FMN-binding negative transcriptional regulator [Phreatobacter stygius]QCI66769.1 FMN-binding negative transcriptional regulator [Phreatobacter stygius]
MYTPPAYREDRLDILHDLMRQWSFATLISSGPDGLLATQLPFLIDANSGKGRLVTHLARANPQCAHLADGREALVVFQGPHAFISPSWYDNRQTFPTWNYTAIHAYGRPVTSDDADVLRALLKRVIARYDTPLGGPWRFEDMPEAAIAPRLKAIIAVEIDIDRLEGKLKLNQDKTPADRAGVIAELEGSDDPVATQTATMMRRLDT